MKLQQRITRFYSKMLLKIYRKQMLSQLASQQSMLEAEEKEREKIKFAEYEEVM